MIHNLNNLLIQLESTVPQFEKLNQEISKSNVGWHIEHSLLTLNAIIDFLPNSNPKEYKWKFNFIRIVILTIKKIPRGKGKAPKVVQPKENYTLESLNNHLSVTKEKIKELKLMSSDRFFIHPYFGKIKLKQTINFLEIHTKHHLDIINDILK
jgi:hypothetical protein